MKLLWSNSAKEDIREIYLFYKISATLKIAKKIKASIFSKTKILRKYPEMGKTEENKNVTGKGYRFIVSGNYKIVYRIFDSELILISAVFDCRQNPDKMLNK